MGSPILEKPAFPPRDSRCICPLPWIGRKTAEFRQTPLRIDSPRRAPFDSPSRLHHCYAALPSQLLQADAPRLYSKLTRRIDSECGRVHWSLCPATHRHSLQTTCKDDAKRTSKVFIAYTRTVRKRTKDARDVTPNAVLPVALKGRGNVRRQRRICAEMFGTRARMIPRCRKGICLKIRRRRILAAPALSPPDLPSGYTRERSAPSAKRSPGPFRVLRDGRGPVPLKNALQAFFKQILSARSRAPERSLRRLRKRPSSRAGGPGPRW